MERHRTDIFSLISFLFPKSKMRTVRAIEIRAIKFALVLLSDWSVTNKTAVIRSTPNIIIDIVIFIEIPLFDRIPVPTKRGALNQVFFHIYLYQRNIYQYIIWV